MTDVVVVGGGLIGSSAARHLAEEGASVKLLAPTQGNPDGVHASHYDQARITRYIDHDPVWSKLAAASIAHYADIETRSGITFHTACGHLRCDLPAEHADSVLSSVRTVAATLPGQVVGLTPSEVRSQFPFLDLGAGGMSHWDAPPSGYINPLALVRAQQELARQAGAEVESAVATQVTRKAAGLEVRDAAGRVHAAGKVLVCAGAYTERFPLLPQPIELQVRPETVVLMEVDAPGLSALADMPSLIWNFPEGDGFRYVYVLPPVRYPDGRWYVKVGSDHDPDVDIGTLERMSTYMDSPGSEVTKRLLTPVLVRMVPRLSGSRVDTKPCLLTYTRSGYPVIDEVDTGWYVAAGGCGKSAKSSDQLGKLAADMVLERPWSGFSRSTFSGPG